MTGGEEMRTWTSAAPASRSIRDQGPLSVAAHDRIVDDDEALALDDLAQGVELESDAELAAGSG